MERSENPGGMGPVVIWEHNLPPPPVVAPLAPPGPGTTGLKLIDSYLQTATYVEKAKR